MTEPRGFGEGELFEWHLVVGGIRVELLAEIEIVGTTLHFRDMAIYPTGPDRAAVGAGPLLTAARMQVLPLVRGRFPSAAHHPDPSLGSEARA